MSVKSFQEKYAEAREQAYNRLTKDNIYVGNNYAGNKKRNTFYVKNDFVLNSISNEIKTFISKYGITESEIKDNFSKISTDILETLQQTPDFIEGMKRNNYENKGIVDAKRKKAFTNEQIKDPKNKDSALKMFGVESNSKFFNKIFSPDQAGYTLIDAKQHLNEKSSIDDIKNALSSLATVNKIHDSRPYFGRPEGYKSEAEAIDVLTKKLRTFGLTNNDMSTILKSSDKELENTINNVCHNRFEIKNERIDQNDYSKANYDKLSPYNLEFAFTEGRPFIAGTNQAKHGIKILNAYIAAKDKYNKAGFFTKHFNKDYRDLKKTIDNVENYLTETKSFTSKDGKKIDYKMFTPSQLKELQNRKEPLSVERDLKFLDDHHIHTYEYEDIKSQQKENNEQDKSRERIEVSEVNNQFLQEYNKEEKTNDVPVEIFEKQAV